MTSFFGDSTTPPTCVDVKQNAVQSEGIGEHAGERATDGTHEFFFTASPKHISGAVGSPIHPQAIK